MHREEELGLQPGETLGPGIEAFALPWLRTVVRRDLHMDLGLD